MIENEVYFWINVFLAVCCAADIFVVFKRDLMMLQQNSYRNERYVRWFNTSSESSSPWRLGACIALFLLLVNHLPHVLTALLSALILLANFINYASRKYKKPLVFTPRAIRIYVVMLLLGFALPIVLGICLKSIELANKLGILVIVISPAFLLLSNLLLRPVESAINRGYYNDAKKILKSNKELKVIGITGSYGKTSTKHFLQHLLSQKFDSVMTPGSFNTLLGVIRTIRENLRPHTEVFVVEMGAKQKGDIKEICDLVDPVIGIVASIGAQHLETFKSVENILSTKFELIDSLPANGLGVINDSNPIVAKRKVDNTHVVYYNKENTGSYRIADLKYNEHGSEFTIMGPDEWSIHLKTPLLGEANILNLLAAVIVGRQLGLTDREINYGASTMPQVEHRLQLMRNLSGYTIIDDAYNSNPEGAKMALEVLGAIACGGKKIIITPGMIELGEQQYELNKRLGKAIGDSVDMAIIVGQYNRDALLEGLSQSEIAKDKVYSAPSLAEAQKIMLTHVNRGDVVLYENDLPDTFK